MDRLRTRPAWPIAALLALTLLPGPRTAAAARNDAVKSLPPKYRTWLQEEAVWILTKEERTDFLLLKTDEERDRFIDNFWAIRDPQPLTKENEFRDEHYRRLEWANRNLGSDATRKGSLSERGRVYVLLGKPADIERQVTATNEVYPYEMWFYGDTARLGLPGQMRLLFYRPQGFGEYRLLNPAVDMDRMFPPSSQLNREDTVEVRNLLGPEVAQAIVEVAPGYGTNASDEIVQELRSPTMVPERIRDHGLAMNPQVRTRVDLKPLKLALKSMIEPLEDGSARVHLGAELPPAEVTFQQGDGDRWLSRIEVFGDVTDEKGTGVARFGESATLSLTKIELERRKGNGFAFETVRTLIPGRYRATLFLQDYAAGKLGRAEAELEVPGPGHGPVLAPFALAFRVDPRAAGDAPLAFTVGGFRLHTRAANRFRKGETVYACAILREGSEAPPRDLNVTVEVRHEGAAAFSASAKSGAATATRGTRSLLLAVPTAGIAPGSYQVTLSVRGDGGGEVARASLPMEVAESNVPGGYFVYEEKRSSPPEVEHLNRGIQLYSKGDLAGAQRHFRIALDHRQGFRPAMAWLARAYLLAGKPDEAAPVLDRLLTADPDNYDGLITRGTLLLSRGDYAGASAALRRAYDTGPKTKELLNGLGEAAMGTGDAESARRWFTESLALDPQQEVAKKRLAGLGS